MAAQAEGRISRYRATGVIRCALAGLYALVRSANSNAFRPRWRGSGPHFRVKCGLTALNGPPQASPADRSGRFARRVAWAPSAAGSRPACSTQPSAIRILPSAQIKRRSNADRQEKVVGRHSRRLDPVGQRSLCSLGEPKENVADVAPDCATSESTVRSQMRGVLGKTVCSRQTDAVALFAGLSVARLNPIG
jgi:hypothetical protein